jgi:outer membrane protein TolC
MRALGLSLLFCLAALRAGGETYRFTLEQAVAYGVQHSTGIRGKALALEAAKQDLAAARSAYYPSLSAGLSYAHLFEQPSSPASVLPANSFGPGNPPADVPLFPQTYLAAADPVTLSANLSQTIYAFGKLKGGVRLAQEAVAQASLDLKEEIRKTAVLIKRAYFGYLLALEVQSINRETLLRKQEALEVAGLRYAAGQVPDYEVLRAESDLETYRATVISSDNAVRVTLLNARSVLGIQEEEFEFELLGELEPLEFRFDPEALQARALEKKYELASFRNGMDLLKAQGSLNRSLRLPTLSGFVGFALASGFEPVTGKNEYFSADAWDGNWTAGLSFNVSLTALLPWSKESAAIRKSALQLENMKQQYQSLESGVRIAVETAMLKIAEQEAKIASGRKSVALAERLYQSADEQYRSGYISSTDLKDAQLGLNGAQLALAQAVFGYNQNVLDLMDAVGLEGEEKQ